ncbi:hypothetical protein BN1013_00247 [Candidatus Rubidus massiliensis]|nr:hypothetical protein BN1013_00247 [Candidatus Rubidus massiliensis]
MIYDLTSCLSNNFPYSYSTLFSTSPLLSEILLPDGKPVNVTFDHPILLNQKNVVDLIDSIFTKPSVDVFFKAFTKSLSDKIKQCAKFYMTGGFVRYLNEVCAKEIVQDVWARAFPNVSIELPSVREDPYPYHDLDFSFTLSNWDGDLQDLKMEMDLLREKLMKEGVVKKCHVKDFYGQAIYCSMNVILHDDTSIEFSFYIRKKETALFSLTNSLINVEALIKKNERDFFVEREHAFFFYETALLGLYRICYIYNPDEINEQGLWRYLHGLSKGFVTWQQKALDTIAETFFNQCQDLMPTPPSYIDKKRIFSAFCKNTYLRHAPNNLIYRFTLLFNLYQLLGATIKDNSWRLLFEQLKKDFAELKITSLDHLKEAEAVLCQLCSLEGVFAKGLTKVTFRQVKLGAQEFYALDDQFVLFVPCKPKLPLSSWTLNHWEFFSLFFFRFSPLWKETLSQEGYAFLLEAFALTPDIKVKQAIIVCIWKSKYEDIRQKLLNLFFKIGDVSYAPLFSLLLEHNYPLFEELTIQLPFEEKLFWLAHLLDKPVTHPQATLFFQKVSFKLKRLHLPLYFQLAYRLELLIDSIKDCSLEELEMAIRNPLIRSFLKEQINDNKIPYPLLLSKLFYLIPNPLKFLASLRNKLLEPKLPIVFSLYLSQAEEAFLEDRDMEVYLQEMETIFGLESHFTTFVAFFYKHAEVIYYKKRDLNPAFILWCEKILNCKTSIEETHCLSPFFRFLKEKNGKNSLPNLLTLYKNNSPNPFLQILLEKALFKLASFEKTFTHIHQGLHLVKYFYSPFLLPLATELIKNSRVKQETITLLTPIIKKYIKRIPAIELIPFWNNIYPHIKNISFEELFFCLANQILTANQTLPLTNVLEIKTKLLPNYPTLFQDLTLSYLQTEIKNSSSTLLEQLLSVMPYVEKKALAPLAEQAIALETNPIKVLDFLKEEVVLSKKKKEKLLLDIYETLKDVHLIQEIIKKEELQRLDFEITEKDKLQNILINFFQILVCHNKPVEITSLLKFAIKHIDYIDSFLTFIKERIMIDSLDLAKLSNEVKWELFTLLQLDKTSIFETIVLISWFEFDNLLKKHKTIFHYINSVDKFYKNFIPHELFIEGMFKLLRLYEKEKKRENILFFYIVCNESLNYLIQCELTYNFSHNYDFIKGKLEDLITRLTDLLPIKNDFLLDLNQTVLKQPFVLSKQLITKLHQNGYLIQYAKYLESLFLEFFSLYNYNECLGNLVEGLTIYDKTFFLKYSNKIKTVLVNNQTSSSLKILYWVTQWDIYYLDIENLSKKIKQLEIHKVELNSLEIESLIHYCSQLFIKENPFNIEDVVTILNTLNKHIYYDLDIFFKYIHFNQTFLFSLFAKTTYTDDFFLSFLKKIELTITHELKIVPKELITLIDHIHDFYLLKSTFLFSIGEIYYQYFHHQLFYIKEDEKTLIECKIFITKYLKNHSRILSKDTLSNWFIILEKLYQLLIKAYSLEMEITYLDILSSFLAIGEMEKQIDKIFTLYTVIQKDKTSSIENLLRIKINHFFDNQSKLEPFLENQNNKPFIKRFLKHYFDNFLPYRDVFKELYLKLSLTELKNSFEIWNLKYSLQSHYKNDYYSLLENNRGLSHEEKINLLKNIFILSQRQREALGNDLFDGHYLSLFIVNTLSYHNYLFESFFPERINTTEIAQIHSFFTMLSYRIYTFEENFLSSLKDDELYIFTHLEYSLYEVLKEYSLFGDENLNINFTLILKLLSKKGYALPLINVLELEIKQIILENNKITLSKFILICLVIYHLVINQTEPFDAKIIYDLLLINIKAEHGKVEKFKDCIINLIIKRLQFINKNILNFEYLKKTEMLLGIANSDFITQDTYNEITTDIINYNNFGKIYRFQQLFCHISINKFPTVNQRAYTSFINYCFYEENLRKKVSITTTEKKNEMYIVRLPLFILEHRIAHSEIVFFKYFKKIKKLLISYQSKKTYNTDSNLKLFLEELEDIFFYQINISFLSKLNKPIDFVNLALRYFAEMIEQKLYEKGKQEIDYKKIAFIFTKLKVSKQLKDQLKKLHSP